MLRRETNFHGGFYWCRCDVGRQDTLYRLSVKNRRENGIIVDSVITFTQDSVPIDYRL